MFLPDWGRVVKRYLMPCGADFADESSDWSDVSEDDIRGWVQMDAPPVAMLREHGVV